MGTYPFDYNKACFVLDSFGTSTGLTCRLLDDEGNTISQSGTHSNIYEKLKLNLGRLKESFLYGSNQASIYGGSFIYFGPYGLVYFTTPIILTDQIVGAFVVGPILMTEPDQYLYERILEQSRIDATSDDNIIEILEEVPVLSTKRVKARRSYPICPI